MIDNSVLKSKFEKQLLKLDLNDEQKEKLVAEINFFSNILIDIFQSRKSNDQRKT